METDNARVSRTRTAISRPSCYSTWASPSSAPPERGRDREGAPFADLLGEHRRIEVIADDEEEIIEAVTRMAGKYDLVVTSGGIGPTVSGRSAECGGGSADLESLEQHDGTLLALLLIRVDEFLCGMAHSHVRAKPES